MKSTKKRIMLQAIGALLLMLGSNVTVSAQSNPVTSFPWTEDFNNLTAEGSIPAGWNNNDGTTGATTEEEIYKWGYTTNSSSQERGFGSCNGTGHDGSKCIRFDSYNNDENNTNLLKTRTISLPNTPYIELSFWYRNPAGGDFSVYISTDGGNTYATALVEGLKDAPMWKEQFISLADYAGQDVVIVFIGTSNYGEDFTDAYIYLDDVSVGYAKPKNLTIKKANKNEADLSWTTPQAESPNSLKYVYRYKKAADNAWSLESEESSAIIVTLFGLAEVTQYDFQVRAVYADGAKSAYTSIKFMTPYTNEGDYYLWMEDFNSLTEDGSIPANWDNSEGTITKNLIRWGYYSSVSGNGACNGTSFDGSNCVVFNSNHNDDGTTNCLKTLPIKLPGRGTTLSFWYKNPWGGNFSVYISTDGGITYETALATNLTNAYDWTWKKIHLDAYGDKSVVIVFKGTSNHQDDVNEGYIYLDDVIIWDRGIGIPPTCLTATKITQHTAKLDWKENVGEDIEDNLEYIIYYRVKDKEDTDYTELSHIKKPYTLTGLEAGTAYEFYVRGYYDGGSMIYSKTYTFSTLGKPATSFPWSENFNSLSKAGSIPGGWDNSDGTTAEADYRWSYSGSGRNDTGCVRFDSHENKNGGTNFLKTIPLSLPATPAMQLDFWYKNPKGGDLSVYISTDDGATYETALVTGHTGAADWKELDEPISLEAYAGKEVVIVFKGTSNHGDGDAYIYLDDITVDEASPCAAPSRPFVTNNKPHAVDLGWRANGDESSWTIYYKKVGDTNYTEVAGVTENPYTLTGLKANTDYEFYVTAACPAASEGYTASKTCQFSTSYVVDPTHPFFESFEGTTFVPPLWDSNNFSGERWVRDNITAHTGSTNALATGSGYSYLVMPSIELAYDISSATLTFWSYYMYLEDYAGGKTSVVLINGTSETELWALSQEEAKSMTNMQWYETSIDLTVYRGQTIQLAFKYESNNAHIWHLDDVSLAVVQTSLEVETATNGSIAFYGDVSCTGDPITATGTGCTVYIKATPQSGFACGLADANGKVSFIKVEKTVKSGVTQTQGTDLGSFIDVYATTTPGVFSFTMPNDANIRVKATVVFPRAATVTAQAASKFVGEDDPTLTATVEGVVGSDKINYTISRAAGETPGEYAITVNGEAVQGNYVVTFVSGAKLTITAKPGDINLDGKVNVADIVKAISAGKTKDEIDKIVNIIMDR